MYYQNRLTHYIGAGESLYSIANLYNTTAENILTENRHINPYYLQAGQVLYISPKHESSNYLTDFSRHAKCITPQQIHLNNMMRMFWEQHVMWTRMLIISIVNNLNDLKQVQTRLLRNPYDIASLFGKYYGKDVESKIAQLITEHLVIGGDLITAYKEGNTNKINELNKAWYLNAEDIATSLSTINPYYSRQELQAMLFNHLDLTKKEVAMRIAGNYEEDIRTFDEIEKQALEMADYFVRGIVMQFPNMFM